MRRRIATLTAAALALGWLTACEPPPPPATFTVNVTGGVTDDDATPGDGVCETAPGNGQCTLNAAVQEGNALGRADIHVPQPVLHADQLVLTETIITGQLTLMSGERIALSYTIATSDLHVSHGAGLSLRNLDFGVADTARVDGTLTMEQTLFHGWIDIGPTGAVTLLNTTGGPGHPISPTPASGAWITNRGLLLARYSWFTHYPWLGPRPAVVNTLDDGATQFGASMVMRQDAPVATDCLGTTPVSEGYNTVFNCGFTAAGDDDTGSAGHDTADIPPGVVGCGTTVTSDFAGNPRPEPDAWRPGHCTRGLYD